MRNTKVFLVLICSLFAVTANAQIVNEIGDAPGLLPGQAVGPSTTQIIGDNLDGTEDLFSFIWGGGDLTIDTFGSDFDTQLHLFDGAGAGIGENDDSGFIGVQSEIALNLAAGSYFIGLTGFNNDALDSSGADIFGFTNTFDDLNGNTIQGPEDSPAGVLAGWSGGGDTGNYNINFSSAVSVSVPEPSSTIVCGMFASCVLLRRRKV